MNNKTMKTAAGQATEKLVDAQIGRSLWDDAWARLKANRAAMTSFVVLFVIALSCFFGPFFTGHQYDTVYRNYVKVPSSLAAYPRDEEIAPALEKVLSRARLTAESVEIGDKQVIVKATSKRSINEKSVRYFDRSDLFKEASFSDFSEDKKSVTVTAKIDRMHFYFGTDANGRDLLTRTLIAGAHFFDHRPSCFWRCAVDRGDLWLLVWLFRRPGRSHHDARR